MAFMGDFRRPMVNLGACVRRKGCGLPTRLCGAALKNQCGSKTKPPKTANPAAQDSGVCLEHSLLTNQGDPVL
jgi:hypothetical protein